MRYQDEQRGDKLDNVVSSFKCGTLKGWGVDILTTIQTYYYNSHKNERFTFTVKFIYEE